MANAMMELQNPSRDGLHFTKAVNIFTYRKVAHAHAHAHAYPQSSSRTATSHTTKSTRPCSMHMDTYCACTPCACSRHMHMCMHACTIDQIKAELDELGLSAAKLPVHRPRALAAAFPKELHGDNDGKLRKREYR